MAWRALVVLLAAMPLWLGVVARQDSRLAGQPGESGKAVAQTTTCGASATPGCGCGGRCATPGCECEVKPDAPAPIEDAPAVPAGREFKPTLLALAMAPRGFFAMPRTALVPSAVRRLNGPFWSYDSVQSFLCVWRS